MQYTRWPVLDGQGGGGAKAAGVSTPGVRWFVCLCALLHLTSSVCVGNCEGGSAVFWLEANVSPIAHHCSTDAQRYATRRSGGATGGPSPRFCTRPPPPK